MSLQNFNKKQKFNRALCPDILIALAVISHFAKSLGNLLEINERNNTFGIVVMAIYDIQIVAMLIPNRCEYSYVYHGFPFRGRPLQDAIR